MPPSVSPHNADNADVEEVNAQYIEKLREAIGPDILENAPLFQDDFTMLRWLRGYDYKIEAIVPHFCAAVRIVDALNVTTPPCTDVDEFNDIVRKLTPCAEYFPGGLMSFDRQGNAVFFQCLCRVHPRSLVQCERVSMLYRAILCECVMMNQMVHAREQKAGRKLGIRIIVDLNGFTSDLLYTPTIKIYLNLLKLIQEVFPDTTESLYVINAPSMISALFSVIKPALSKNTQEKIVFVSKDHEKFLRNVLGEENLLERFGGTLKSHSEFGSLRMGGVCPDHMKYDPAKNPYHVDNQKLIKINVPARSKKEIRMTSEARKGKLRWFFTTSNDIDFYILRDNINIWPKYRLSTEFVPEWGELDITGAKAEYCIGFDNTYSLIFGKEVRFHIFFDYE